MTFETDMLGDLELWSPSVAKPVIHGPVAVDRNHLHLRGVDGIWLFSHPDVIFDVLNNVRFNTVNNLGTFFRTGTALGDGVEHSGVAFNQYIQSSDADRYFPFTNELFLFALFELSSTAGVISTPIIHKRFGFDGYTLGIIPGTGKVFVEMGLDDIGSFSKVEADVTFVADECVSVAATYRAGIGITLFYKGDVVGNLARTGTFRTGQSGKALQFISGHDANFRSLEGRMFSALYGDQYKCDEEVISIMNDPYAFLRAEQKPSQAPVISGAAPAADLVMSDAESATEAGAAKLTQTHSCKHSGAESVTDADATGLTQTHQSKHSRAESATTASKARLTQTHQATAVDAESATAADSLKATQQHNAATADASSAATAGAAKVAQEHETKLCGAESVTEADSMQISLEAIVNLQLSGAASATTASKSAVTQAHNGKHAGAEAATDADRAGIQQTQQFKKTDAFSVTEASEIEAPQGHHIKLAGALSESTADSISVVTDNTIFLNLRGASSASTANRIKLLAQTHALKLADAYAGSYPGSMNLSIAKLGLVQNPGAESVTIKRGARRAFT